MGVRAEVVQGLFEEYVQNLEAYIRKGDQAGFYKHLTGIPVEGKRTYSSQYIQDEEEA